MNRALLISDLHYKQDTANTVIDILNYVKQKAKEQNCDVYFLGDFWDHVYSRGTVPVDLLNRMLRFMSEWDVNMIMIPGNHDYFDSSETEHGLEAFARINPRITVVSEPTVIDSKLFLPYRKNPEHIKNAVQTLEGYTSIYGHLDVIGATMHGNVKAKKGIQHDVLKVPTYSGHYHTANKYNNVTYIGSLYQVHLGEYKDTKRLLMVNKEGMLIQAFVMPKFGRVHYKHRGVLDVDIDSLKTNDRVVCEIYNLGDEAAAKRRKLKEMGVIVEEQKAFRQTTTRMKVDDLKDASPETVWHNFIMNIQETEAEGIWVETVTDFVKKEIFEKMVRSTLPMQTKKLLNVKFNRMVITDFGPFKGKHEITFEDGMRLVTGKHKQSTTADSNGVGKSMYTVGAFLWACTGKTDERFDSSKMLTGECISDGANSTNVILYGTVNNEAFTITRQMTRVRKISHALYFFMAGSSNSRNTLAMTQSKINESIFGFSVGIHSTSQDLHNWLTRCMIWTQKSSPRFLNSSDSKSKEEMSELVDIEYWKQAHEFTKDRLHNIKKTKQKIGWEQTNSAGTLTYLQRKQKTAEDKHIEWQVLQANKIEQVKESIDRVQKRVNEQKTFGFRDVELLHEKRRSIQADIYVKQKEQNDFEDNYRYPDELRDKHLQLKHLRTYKRKLRSRFNPDGHIMGNKCHTCHSIISDEQMRKRSDEMDAELTELTKQDDEIKEQMKKKKEEDVAVFFKKMSGELGELDQQLKEVKKTIDTTDDYNKQINDQNNDRARLAALKERLLVMESMVNPHDPSDYDSKIQEEKEKIVMLTNRKAVEEDNMVKLMMLKHLFGKTGIQSVILETASKRLEQLVCEITLEESFTIDHDETNEKIVKQFGGKPLRLLSGGEFQRLQIACFLAYGKLLKEIYSWNSNLLLFDEPDVYVDTLGSKKMMQMINNQAENKSIWIISHTNSMHRDMGVFEDHIVIEKTQEGSKKRKRIF